MGSRLTRTVTPTAEGKYEIGEIGVLPNTHPHIRSVVAGEPADKAGLKADDVDPGGQRRDGQLLAADFRS